jgi:hypothetical protein
LQGPTAGRLRFQLAALHPADPIKRRTSTQRTQASQRVDIRKRFACRALADRPCQCRALRRRAFARSARTTAPRSSRAVMGASPAHRQAAYGSSTSSLSPTRRSSVRPRSHRRAAYGSSTSSLSPAPAIERCGLRQFDKQARVAPCRSRSRSSAHVRVARRGVLDCAPFAFEFRKSNVSNAQIPAIRRRRGEWVKSALRRLQDRLFEWTGSAKSGPRLRGKWDWPRGAKGTSAVLLCLRHSTRLVEIVHAKAKPRYPAHRRAALRKHREPLASGV